MRARPQVLARPAALVTLIFLAACAGEIPAPASPTAAMVLGSARANAATARRRIPNAVKYRDAGAKPAKGRSGSASLEVRALLGSNGDVTVEASTGSIEAGTSIGDIQKIQVKRFAGKGSTQNYTKLPGGGYWSATYQGLARNDAIQVQASIKGIDPKRADVVTVVASVTRGPDLAVMSVSGPGDAPTDVPVTFSAVLGELNDDLGARATCVLSVDGAAVARASGIWVDAGDNVSCLFTHAFATSGTHDVRVSLVDVAPGDWDTSNNSAATSINIIADGTNIRSGNLSAYDFDYTVRTRQYNLNGQFPFDNKYDTKFDRSFVSAYGEELIELPGLQRIDIAIELDGVPFHSTSLTIPTDADYSDDGTTWLNCWSFEDIGYTAHSCSYGSRDPESPFATTYYQIQRQSGTVTYHADEYNCTESSCGTYSYNSVDVYGNGVRFEIGSSLRFLVSIVDGLGQSHTIDKTIRNFVDDVFTIGPYFFSCYDDALRGGQSCFEDSYLTNGRLRHGSVSWP